MDSNHLKRKPVAHVQEVPEQRALRIEGSQGEHIVLFKKEGKIYALDDCCPHMDAPLSEGEVADGVVTCPWHGWKFHVDSGICVNMPGQNAYPIDLIIEGDYIYLRE